ncbi:MAG: LysR family transcriptional regulator [Oceanospirillales bacterium]|nr:LysR family transcriptional regulator [Oceanospirillales bacterium]
MKTTTLNSPDRIELLQTFVRIVESGSLSAAAAQLSTTQPTVSRRLQALEARLGCKLILRTTHAMKLTDDGERCYAHAKSLIECWNTLEDDLLNANDEPVGTLRVRAPHAFGQEQLLTPLTDFLTRYSRMSVDWMLNDHSPDFINDGLDCAIHVGDIHDSSAVAVLLAEVPRIVVASPALLARHRALEEVEDLASLPWVALSTFYRNSLALQSEQHQRSCELTFTPKLCTDSLYALRNAILSGIGVGVVSSWIVTDDIASGKLVRLFPQWCAAPLPVYLQYPYASYYPARLRKFLELVKDAMSNLAGTRPPTQKWQ